MSRLKGKDQPGRIGAPLAVVRRMALLIALLGATGEVWASRLHRPLGDYVREAAVIVIADTKRGGAYGGDTILTVTEVLKGAPKLLGQEIVFGMELSTADARVPAPSKGLAVMLAADWQEKTNHWPVIEACNTPEQVAAVRVFIAVYGEATERQRLVALEARALAGDAVCLDQLLSDLRGMREPGNFDLMTDLYPKLQPKTQVQLVEIMANTGDLRVVPVLLRAMQSTNEEVSMRAASALRFHYPGARGVTEAFTALLEDKSPLGNMAVQYLAPYRADLTSRAEEWTTPWIRADRQWATNRPAARAALLALIVDPQGLASAYTNAQPALKAAPKALAGVSDYARTLAALKLLPEATPAERDQMRQALLPMLTAKAQGGDYIEAETAAQILRGLNHPDCLPALLALITRTGFVYQQATQTAVFAIRELGPEACEEGFTRLLEGLQPVPQQLEQSDLLDGYLLAMIWLGNRTAWNQVTERLPEAHRAAWQRLAPLRSLAEQQDEVAFMIERLRAPGELPAMARAWLVTRLGELKDPRAVPILIDLLVQETNDYHIGVALTTTLPQINGRQAEEALTKLLTHPDRHVVRARAVEALFVMLGERGLPLARRMLQEKDFGSPQAALGQLGQFGTAEDFALVAPWCDYWRADRTLQYWGMQAMCRMRERCGYNINGPIQKAPAKQ
jgi:HEAT repeat protein